MSIRFTRLPEKLVSDDKRVVARYLHLEPQARRIRSIAERVMKLGEDRVSRLLAKVLNNFSSRHRDIEAVFRDHFREVSRYLDPGMNFTESRKMLIGAYFTHEYSIEAAALFNPSIIPHPDQSGLTEGSLRFLMSLRATGEGHVSSIVFREGELDGNAEVDLYPPIRYAYSAKPIPDRWIEKESIVDRLTDMGMHVKFVQPILDALPDPFNIYQLEEAVDEAKKKNSLSKAVRNVAANMIWLVRANYELRFPTDCKPSEMVIFPATDNERRGMEDLRLVRFMAEDGRCSYYGTYTAYDGFRILPMLLETCDFHAFRVSTLSGQYAQNKGMALFPRKVGGQYLMICRHDGENLFLMQSDDLYHWDNAKRLQEPEEPWEFVQIGNCGSPLETDSGWILLTHGVGPVREYCIGALLLDRENPYRVIGRLREPLLVPAGEEREGYVPNVVYSCGAMMHHGRLIIPFAMSDEATSFVTVQVSELLDLLLKSGG
jgi:predicted GH43/DUF377 family glycosyl hydrolase